jgi:hypothetical protein
MGTLITPRTEPRAKSSARLVVWAVVWQEVRSRMFSLTFDRAFGIGIGLFSGATNTDDDFQRYCDTVRLLDDLAKTVSVPAFILVLDRENPQPNAKWRKKMTEARERLRSKPVVAFVCDSPILRGAIKAAEWISPRPFPFVVAEDFENAVRWIEGYRPGTKGLLMRLHAELRSGASRSVGEIG